jgi:K+-transporting ATPase ATPase A chain
MTSFAWLQLGGYFALLVGLGVPLGHYMARVYTGEARLSQRILGPVERVLYRLLGIDPGREMGWREYTLAVLAVSVVSLVAVYAVQRLQGVLPVNPAGLPGVPAFLAFNTAVSFVSNTNWQSYGGETTMSHLTQMLALTVQNFVSAAVGMAVLVAFVRGLARRTASTLGNAWVDTTRGVLYVLLPLAAILSLLLVSQGVVQTMEASREVTLVQPF